jgi:hypothetical protein
MSGYVPGTLGRAFSMRNLAPIVRRQKLLALGISALANFSVFRGRSIAASRTSPLQPG